MLSNLKSFLLFLRQPNFVQWFKVLFGLFLIYFAILILHYHYYLITFPYPIMYREGTMMATTTLLLHGINPSNFFLEPQYSNLYGITYPLIVLPFASLYGVTLPVHRAIAAFFILASCAIISLVLNRKKTPLLLNFWAVLTLWASLLYPLTTTPCVDPASTGLFFMLLTIFIPFFLNYTYISLFISIIFGILAFYTKAYFLLGLPVVTSYLFLFVSKKKSVLFGCCCLIGFMFSVVAMNYFFPSYFDNCFFVNYNISPQTSMMIVLERQLHKFAQLHIGIIIAMLLVLLYALLRGFWTSKTTNIKSILRQCLSAVQLRNWEAPLIIKQLPLDIYAGIYFAAVLVLCMGKHFGANMWYFFQLFSPFLMITTAWVTGRFRLWPILFSFFLIFNLYSLSSDYNYKYFDKNQTGWLSLEKLVQSNSSIFNSSLIAPLLIKENKEIFEDGAEHFIEGGHRRGLLAQLFAEDKRVFAAQTLLFNRVQNMIIYKKFDLIIIEAGYASNLIPDSFRNFYKFVGPILVNTPQDRKSFLITVWKPI
ncbi:MAG: hypothetical protein HQL14_05095 [Candidatus Omnitrophica bacterium]|nr:hypothetical protein [Candidatus Omnitrophota bacterium]